MLQCSDADNSMTIAVCILTVVQQGCCTGAGGETPQTPVPGTWCYEISNFPVLCHHTFSQSTSMSHMHSYDFTRSPHDCAVPGSDFVFKANYSSVQVLLSWKFVKVKHWKKSQLRYWILIEVILLDVHSWWPCIARRQKPRGSFRRTCFSYSCMKKFWWTISISTSISSHALGQYFCWISGEQEKRAGDRMTLCFA